MSPHTFKVGDLLVFDRTHFSSVSSEWYITPMLVLATGEDWIEIQVRDDVIKTKAWVYMKKLSPLDEISNDSSMEDWQINYIKQFEQMKMYETLFESYEKKIENLSKKECRFEGN